jgi:hypothetical protein
MHLGVARLIPYGLRGDVSGTELPFVSSQLILTVKTTDPSIASKELPLITPWEHRCWVR